MRTLSSFKLCLSSWDMGTTSFGTACGGFSGQSAWRRASRQMSIKIAVDYAVFLRKR